MGETCVNGGGIDGSIAIGDFSVIGSYGIYRLSHENTPSTGDWTQNRAYIGVAHRFGIAPRVRSSYAGGGGS